MRDVKNRIVKEGERVRIEVNVPSHDGMLYKDSIVTRLGGFMIAVIMLGAIYMHAFSWKDKGFLELEWQMLLFATSLMFVFKGDEI